MYKNSTPAPSCEKRNETVLSTLGKARVSSASQPEYGSTNLYRFNVSTNDHLQEVNGQSQEIHTTKNAGSLPLGPVYEVCGGPENSDTYSHVTTKRGCLVSAATISASSLGVQTRARRHANRRNTMATHPYNEPADALPTDNVPGAGRGISSTSQSDTDSLLVNKYPGYSHSISSTCQCDTYSQPADFHFVDKYPGSTQGTSSTCQSDTNSQPADSLLEGKHVDTGGRSQVDDAMGILARGMMASCDGSTVTEGTRATTGDGLVLQTHCTGPIATNMYSQPADALTRCTKGPIPCHDVIEADRAPMLPGNTDIIISMPTTNIIPSAYLTPKDMMLTLSFRTPPP